MQAVKQPVTYGELRPPRSIRSPFRRTMADYICSSSYFVISLQSESINHIIKGHLNNPIYKPIPSNTDQKVFQNLRKLVDKYSLNLTKKEKEYVLNNTWKTSEFYCTIKARKSIEKAILKNDTIINVLKPNDLKGRPIIAGPNSPTQVFKFPSRKNSQTYFTMVKTTYIKDDLHFIKQLPRTLKL